MTEMEFLESLSKEQAEYYAKSIDELCEMLPKKPEETWEDAGKSEDFKKTQILIKAEKPVIRALCSVEKIAEQVQQAVTALEVARDVAFTREKNDASPFDFVPEKIKTGITVMWMAHRELEFCVSRMRMFLGEGETAYAEWIETIERVNGHGQ